MKKNYVVLAFLLTSMIYPQEGITVAAWQEDVRFLQKKVNEQYSFLFKKISKSSFNAEIEDFYHAIPQMEQHEIVVGFSRIIALFKYGHTRMSYGDSPVPFHSIPVEFYRFKDGVYIKSAHKDHLEIVGAKAKAIEGIGIDEVIKAVYPTVPVENALFFDAYGLDHMTIPEVLHAQGVTSKLKKDITLTLEKDGKSFEYMLTATTDLWPPMHYGEIKQNSDWVNQRDQSFTPYYLKNFDNIYYFDYLRDEKTVYVRHSQIQDDPKETVEDFYSRVFAMIDNNEVEKFVLDVRLNGGGNSFLNKPIITGIIANKKINRPGRFFVITGRRTFSAAQRLINELDNYTNVLFVGEPSSENINFFGDNKKVVLPNSKLPVYLSFAWWQDKAQWQNADYIKPHYPIAMTYRDYITNQDPSLETILSFNPHNFTLEPVVYLLNLFDDDKVEEARKEMRHMVDEPAYAFFDFERELSNKAFILLGNDNDKALFLFELTTLAFPESQNSWVNLAQAQLEIGNYGDAKSSCEKALLIPKEGGASNKAKRMLKEINQKL
ncbi:MAG: hypothetical protein AAGC45_10685 [Bacteroidota bacterium]